MGPLPAASINRSWQNLLSWLHNVRKLLPSNVSNSEKSYFRQSRPFPCLKLTPLRVAMTDPIQSARPKVLTCTLLLIYNKTRLRLVSVKWPLETPSTSLLPTPAFNKSPKIVLTRDPFLLLPFPTTTTCRFPPSGTR